LEELAIGIRPVMPTENVCRVYNELRQDITVLIELQTQMEKKEYELQLLRAQVDQIDNTYSIKTGKKRGTNDFALSSKRQKKEK